MRAHVGDGEAQVLEGGGLEALGARACGRVRRGFLREDGGKRQCAGGSDPGLAEARACTL